MMDERAWSKAERLAVAAIVAPAVREAARTRRPVKTLDRDGKVARVVDIGDVVAGVLATRKIELEVQEGVRPISIDCEMCHRKVSVQQNGGLIPRVCRNGCLLKCACGAVFQAKKCAAQFALSQSRVLFCPKCKRQRMIEGTKARQAARSPEAKSESSRRSNQNLTEEQKAARRDLMRKISQAQDPKIRQRSAAKMLEARARMTSEERSEASRKAMQSRSASEKSASAIKGAATRRLKTN